MISVWLPEKKILLNKRSETHASARKTRPYRRHESDETRLTDGRTRPRIEMRRRTYKVTDESMYHSSHMNLVDRGRTLNDPNEIQGSC